MLAYLSILSHFKLINTPKIRMILTQTEHCTDMYINWFSKLCFMVIHRNCRLASQAIQTHGKSYEFHATHGIKIRAQICFALFRCLFSYKGNQFLRLNILFSSTCCLHVLRPNFFSLHQPFHFLHSTFFQTLYTSSIFNASSYKQTLTATLNIW